MRPFASFRADFQCWHERCSFTPLLQGGDFDHAVDNFGDSVGLVADWPALKCWWQSHPLIARRGRRCSGYQPDYWEASSLRFNDIEAKVVEERDCLLSKLRS